MQDDLGTGTAPEPDGMSPGPPAEVEALASAGGPTQGSTGRWLLIAVFLVLVVYPATRWLMSSEHRAGAPTAVARAQIQASFQLYQAGRYEEAITDAKAVLAANPDSADAYNNLAVSYMALGRVDEAIEAATQALRINPAFQLARNNLAWFQQEKARADRPPVSPEQAAQAATFLNQSLQHAQAQRYVECVEAATKATTLNPASAAAFNNLGYCLGAMHRWDEAIRYTEQAIRLDPSLQLAKNNLAWMQQQKARAGSTGDR
jgi:tetratricopeptide (TPR) repeat protein